MTILIVFALTFVAIAAVDLWLVSTGRRSISVTFWLAESAHPTLLVLVMLVGLALGYYTRDNFWVSASALISLGHLVTTEGAAVALTTTKRWTGK